MFKLIFSWLFGMSLIADIVIVALKLLGWLSWSWGLIVAIPFVAAIAGTIAFAIFYLIIKIFVTMIMR